MVGVGGRSKACENCKSRRVKCGRSAPAQARHVCVLTSGDLRKPQCGRCVTARLQCGGPRGITIIQCDGHGKFARPEDRNPADCSALQVSTRATGQPHLEIHRGLSFPHDDVFTAFTLSHLLPEQGASESTPGILTRGSFLALATTYFGIKRQEKAITQYGFKRYSDALRVVHSALESSRPSPSFDLLEAIMIMALIEVRNTSYSAHLFLQLLVSHIGWRGRLD
jgi:hypothetical protein